VPNVLVIENENLISQFQISNFLSRLIVAILTYRTSLQPQTSLGAKRSDETFRKLAAGRMPEPLWRGHSARKQELGKLVGSSRRRWADNDETNLGLWILCHKKHKIQGSSIFQFVSFVPFVAITQHVSQEVYPFVCFMIFRGR